MTTREKLQISQRIQNLRTSPIRKLIPYSEAAIAAGKKIYHLNIGQPDVPTPKEFFEAIRSVSMKTLKYEHSQGLKELIAAIGKYYQKKSMAYESNEIMITTGGSEALLYTLITICDQGESILIPEPFYANYNSFYSMLGIKINTVRTYAENGFHLPSIQEIEKALTPDTRAIMISNPGNPTGIVYTSQEMDALASIALKHNLFIISDEVYREFVYGHNVARSFGTYTELQDRVVIIDSISKRFSACGARIGCVISKHRPFIDAVYRLCQSRLAAPSLEMIGAVALYNLDDDYFTEVAIEYKKRRDILFKALSEIKNVVASEPEGAFYTVVKLPVADAEDFCRWIISDFAINNETIMITPAAGFYYTPGLGLNEVRITYALNSDDLVKSMEILKRGLDAYPGRTL